MALTDKLKAIADAIRAKTGKTATMTLEKMPTEIESIVGGGEDFADLLTNNLTTLNSNVTSIRQYTFRGATALVEVNLPEATSIGANSFYGCSKLTSFIAPKLKTISNNAFNGCGAIRYINLPALASGDQYIFRYCYWLLTVDLAVCTNIATGMFNDCRRMTAVILRSPTLVTLAATSAFGNCYHFYGTKNSTYNPDGLKDGYIYVPAALIEEYKAAANWSTLATQFRAIEDYPAITGGN